MSTDGRSDALIWAVHRKQDDEVLRLLKEAEGLNVNATLSSGQDFTALQVGAHSGASIRVLQALLAANADVNQAKKVHTHTASYASRLHAAYARTCMIPAPPRGRADARRVA